MGNKRKRAKGGQAKHAGRRRRGKAVRCSHIDRSTGIPCGNMVGAVKSNIRPFCGKHKKQHDSRHKTRVIVRKNNSQIKKEEREDNLDG